MSDPNAYELESTKLADPALSAEVVTPHDTTLLSNPSRKLYVGVGGNISVEMKGTGSAIVLLGVPTGTMLDIRVSRVNLTLTTATDMVAFY